MAGLKTKAWILSIESFPGSGEFVDIERGGNTEELKVGIVVKEAEFKKEAEDIIKEIFRDE